MADRIGLFLQDEFTVQESIEYVRYAEARGFDSVWQSEVRLARDSIVLMSAYAAVTFRTRIGSAVTNIWTRHPAALALELLTLDDLAADRIMCGLGVWHDPLAAQMGINRHKYLLAMREVVLVLRRLLNFERVTFRGEFVYLQDVMLESTTPRRDPRRIPLYIGAGNPKLLALGGEIADGVLLNYLVSPAYTARMIDQIEVGVQQAGRLLEDVDRPQLILCSVSQDRRQALDRARRVVTEFIVQQPQSMRLNGVSQNLIDEVTRAVRGAKRSRSESIGAGAALVPDDIVQLVSASGTPNEVRAKVREYVAAGCTTPVLYPITPDVRLMVDTFANGYSR